MKLCDIWRWFLTSSLAFS